MMPADPDLHAIRAEAQRLASHGAWGEVAALLDAHRPRVRRVPDSAVLLAEAFMFTGRAREARDWLDDILPGLDATEDRRSTRKATMLSGAASFQLGAIDDARRAFSDALERARLDADDALMAKATNNLGSIANVEGKAMEALALYNLAVSVHQRMGNARGLAQCYHNMAISYRDIGRLREADECERRSVEFARDAEQHDLVALARLGRAELALLRGDAALAEAAARRVAHDFAIASDPVREGDAMRLAGVACTALGRYEDASELLSAALARAREHGALLNEAETLRARAELLALLDRRHAAVEDARAALALFRQLHAERETAALLRWMATLPAES